MEKKLLLPPSERADSSKTAVPPAQPVQAPFPCPCCGCLTLPVPREEALAFICPVCFWENDLFITGDNDPSDENHGLTLREARENVRQIGACSREMLAHARKPTLEEIPKGMPAWWKSASL